MRFDETGKSPEQITKMNAVHGGDNLRVSAAHVLLAAGFKRGQTWGPVRLHPKNLLKIENTGGATARQIYDAAQLIINTVQNQLGISLEPEAQLLGQF
jgi:UDP-N-acetylenolpyruvoylglucosamine reductase